MIHLDPHLGLVNNLQLLTQKLKFRMLQVAASQQQQKQQHHQLQQQQLQQLTSLIASSVNDFYGVEFKTGEYFCIVTNYLENVLNISD